MKKALITIVAVLFMATFAHAFDITGSKSIFNKAEITRVIFEGDNITIEFQEGYEEDGAFVPVGTDHILLTGAEAASATTLFSEAADKTLIAEELVAAAKAKQPVEEEEVLPVEPPVFGE